MAYNLESSGRARRDGLPTATGYTLVTSPSLEIRAIFRSGMLMIRRRLNFREKAAMEPVKRMVANSTMCIKELLFSAEEECRTVPARHPDDSKHVASIPVAGGHVLPYRACQSRHN